MNTASKVRARGGQVANGMFNVSDLMISLGDHFHVAGILSEREGTSEPGACGPEFSE